MMARRYPEACFGTLPVIWLYTPLNIVIANLLGTAFLPVYTYSLSLELFKSRQIAKRSAVRGWSTVSNENVRDKNGFNIKKAVSDSTFIGKGSTSSFTRNVLLSICNNFIINDCLIYYCIFARYYIFADPTQNRPYSVYVYFIGIWHVYTCSQYIFNSRQYYGCHNYFIGNFTGKMMYAHDSIT